MNQGWEPGGPATPSKYAVVRLADDADAAGARPGQVLVLFAIFSMAMMGMLGLATDVGFLLAGKRAVQGAADAGALAGARMIARYTPSTPTTALAEVTTVVGRNNFGSAGATVYTCEYIGNNWSVVGTCNQTVPSSAAGARVRTRMTVNTWFIRVFPAAPDTVRVAGYAKARVQIAKAAPPDAPFILCGPSAWDVTSDPTGIGPGVGANLNIVAGTSPFRVQASAVGKTFRVHDPQLDSKGNADCSSQGDRFKGLADQPKNVGKSAGQWFRYDTGAKAGPTRTKVNGAAGCAAGVDAPYNCVMILPIATNSPAESGNSQQLYVIGFAAFEITEVDSNTHNAKLLDDYITTGAGINNWCRDCGGAVVIRLIW